MIGIFTILGFVWDGFDIWSNLEFIGQKSGVIWNAVYFLFATDVGAKIILVLFVSLFVGSLLFQFERRPELPPPNEPPPLELTEPSRSGPELIEAPKEPEAEERPNLVFKEVQYPYAHVAYGMLAEGEDSGSKQQLVAVTVRIENEFTDEFKAVPVSGITAQILYQPNSAGSLQFNRGAWLHHANRVGFQVNDSKELIIAFFLEGDAEFVAALIKEYQDINEPSMKGLARSLTEDYYRVRVRLISEVLGKRYAEQEYDLEISRNPVDVTLTPRVALSIDEIRQQLERFLKEGNDLLKAFPTQKEQTDEDVRGVDAFEKRVVKFLNRCPDRFSAVMFLNDVPIVKYGGQGAVSGNWLQNQRHD
ncbi:MAG TPA: hypothetical protein VFM05_08495 [Candidatus Saccharimonadales bacterium]|nr:hypothetical protein [Candidatus Saccharimonadales bacterium]